MASKRYFLLQNARNQALAERTGPTGAPHAGKPCAVGRGWVRWLPGRFRQVLLHPLVREGLGVGRGDIGVVAEVEVEIVNL